MGSETAPTYRMRGDKLGGGAPRSTFIRSKVSMDDDLLSAINFYAAQLNAVNLQKLLAKAMLLWEAQQQNINWED